MVVVVSLIVGGVFICLNIMYLGLSFVFILIFDKDMILKKAKKPVCTFCTEY